MDYGIKEHCLKVCQKMNLQTVLDMRLVGVHICSKLVIPANSGGIGPDIWLSSTCILVSSSNLPSSGGRVPVS
jgi:hypothetical protein